MSNKVAPHFHPALPVSFNALHRSSGTGADRQAILRDINLDVNAGEFVAIVGPAGCGKSTLLRATGGLDTSGGGTITIGDTPVAAVDNRCAVTSGPSQLSTEHTIQANVAMGLPIGTSAKHGKAKVAELLNLLGLEQFAKLWPSDLPAGLAERVALAKALARNPGVLLLDEPFSTLDARTRAKTQELLLDIHRVARTTVLMVTDAVDEALQLADRIIVLGSSKTNTDDGEAVTDDADVVQGRILKHDTQDSGSGTSKDGGGPSIGSSIVQVLDALPLRPRDINSTSLARVRDSLLAAVGVGNKSK
ncbi:ABC transporter ATP-binding protein [Arthrobacter castelli]|uniref:ABC transporter ATP-binding protein n=1 Tax=Arthrobacter castelli TaxID=271431 RepID=UPI0004218C60|nr:ATP-binding cassette domain-containing protein [Arthrobacter castelli]